MSFKTTSFNIPHINKYILVGLICFFFIYIYIYIYRQEELTHLSFFLLVNSLVRNYRHEKFFQCTQIIDHLHKCVQRKLQSSPRTAEWFGVHSACTNCQNQEAPGLPSSNIWKFWWSNFFTHFQKFNLNIL